MEENRTQNNATEVLIAGRVYHLSGADSDYIREVAAYLNERIEQIKTVSGYGRMDHELKALLLEINIVDDLFKARQQNEKLREEAAETEKELYAARNDMVNMRMKLEDALKRLEETENRTAGTGGVL